MLKGRRERTQNIKPEKFRIEIWEKKGEEKINPLFTI